MEAGTDEARNGRSWALLMILLLPSPKDERIDHATRRSSALERRTYTAAILKVKIAGELWIAAPW